MNSKETRVLIERIDDAAEAILGRVQINTWVFGVTGALVIALAIMMIVVLTQQGKAFTLAASGQAIALAANKIASEANTQAASNKATQDVLAKQYSDYIQQMISVWDKLQNDNRNIKVPIAPQLRPPGLPQPDKRDLERITGPEPTPRVIIRKEVKHVHHVKPSPTPTPFFRWFKSMR